MPWGVIDVRECGAAGDAHTDDTAAVLEAIQGLPKSGGVLYFPPGNCCTIDTHPGMKQLPTVFSLVANSLSIR